MRAVIQRVSAASVMVDGAVVGQIGRGLLVLLGVGASDSGAEASLLAEKIAHIRIFSDEEGRFNHSLLDVAGSALVVSQFTLYADTRRGRRPGFTDAAPPETAVPLYERFVETLDEIGIETAKGRFGSAMEVELVNDGPFTIWLDSEASAVGTGDEAANADRPRR